MVAGGILQLLNRIVLLAVQTAEFAEELPSAAEIPGVAPVTKPPGLLDSLWNNIKDPSTLDAALVKVGEFGPMLLKAIAVFVIGRFVARVVTDTLSRAATRAKVDETLSRFGCNVLYMVLLTIVCMAALESLGVDTTSLSAVLAAAGFAVGLALQGSLGNFASGVLLVFFKPFRVGDAVEVGGVRGKVIDIQIFSTILLTPDNVRIFVPNGTITSGTIQNFSAEAKRRIDLVVSCGYNDDLRAVKAFLTDLINEDARVLSDPEPVIAVSELADSGVNFVVRPWVNGKDYWDTRFSLIEQIKLGFDEQGFTIPFPSRDVFVHQSANYNSAVIEGSSAAAA